MMNDLNIILVAATVLMITTSVVESDTDLLCFTDPECRDIIGVVSAILILYLDLLSFLL